MLVAKFIKRLQGKFVYNDIFYTTPYFNYTGYLCNHTCHYRSDHLMSKNGVPVIPKQSPPLNSKRFINMMEITNRKQYETIHLSTI